MCWNNDQDSNNNDAHEEGKWELAKYLDYQGDWSEKNRGNLMVVATVLATINFQTMVSPPGGVWQSDDKCDSYGNNCMRVAGMSVLENSSIGSKDAVFNGLVNSCMASFALSMAVIHFLILGISLRSRFLVFLLFSMMGFAVGSTAMAFAYSVELIHSNNASIQSKLSTYHMFWYVIVASPFVFGVVLYAKSCHKKRSNRYSTSSDQTPSTA